MLHRALLVVASMAGGIAGLAFIQFLVHGNVSWYSIAPAAIAVGILAALKNGRAPHQPGVTAPSLGATSPPQEQHVLNDDLASNAVSCLVRDIIWGARRAAEQWQSGLMLPASLRVSIQDWSFVVTVAGVGVMLGVMEKGDYRDHATMTSEVAAQLGQWEPVAPVLMRDFKRSVNQIAAENRELEPGDIVGYWILSRVGANLKSLAFEEDFIGRTVGRMVYRKFSATERGGH